MKKMAMALVLILCVSLVAVAQVSFQESLNAGIKKMNDRHRKDRFREARKDFEKAMELAKNGKKKAEAIKHLANTYYLGRSEHEKARELDARILDIEGSTHRQKVDAQFRIAESLMGWGYLEIPDYAQARAGYAKILQMDGATTNDKAKAIFGIGDAFAAEQKYAQARAEYAKIVKMEDIEPDKPNMATRALYEHRLVIPGRPIKGWSKKEGWRTVSLKIEAQYNIGANYRAEGKFDEAKEAYAKILDMEEASAEYKKQVKQRIRTIYR